MLQIIFLFKLIYSSVSQTTLRMKPKSCKSKASRLTTFSPLRIYFSMTSSALSIPFPDPYIPIPWIKSLTNFLFLGSYSVSSRLMSYLSDSESSKSWYWSPGVSENLSGESTPNVVPIVYFVFIINKWGELLNKIRYFNFLIFI